MQLTINPVLNAGCSLCGFYRVAKSFCKLNANFRNGCYGNLSDIMLGVGVSNRLYSADIGLHLW